MRDPGTPFFETAKTGAFLAIAQSSFVIVVLDGAWCPGTSVPYLNSFDSVCFSLFLGAKYQLGLSPLEVHRVGSKKTSRGSSPRLGSCWEEWKRKVLP